MGWEYRCWLLPSRASEQGIVIALGVIIYIICRYVHNYFFAI